MVTVNIGGFVVEGGVVVDENSTFAEQYGALRQLFDSWPAQGFHPEALDSLFMAEITYQSHYLGEAVVLFTDWSVWYYNAPTGENFIARMGNLDGIEAHILERVSSLHELPKEKRDPELVKFYGELRVAIEQVRLLC